MQKRIIIPASATMELSMNMYKIPEPGEVITDDGGIAYLPGGVGARAAIAFSRLGAEAALVARLGRDLHGQKLYNYYKECGISTAYIKVDTDEPTGLTVVMKDGGGRRRTVVYPGATAKLSADGIADALSCNADGMYLSFELSPELVRDAAKVATRLGVPIFLSPTGGGDDVISQLPPVEVFMPSDDEVERYTGIRPDGAEASLRSAIALSKKIKARYIVMRLASRGAFIYDGMKYFLIPPVSAGPLVDPSSLGDAFSSALVLEYLKTGDIRMAARFAVSAAAIAVTRRGRGAIPSDEEVRRLLLKSEMGY